MLAKTSRLTKENDFKKVFNLGKKITGRFFAAYFLKTPGKTRVAVIVSNKISKKAVIRNKLKRRMREIIKKNLEGLEYDIVVSAKLSALDQKYSELSEDLSSSLKKII